MSAIRFDDARAWLFDRALPLWAANGADAPGLGFLEQLTLDGRPLDPGFKRVRTQARQVYAFCQAEALGWSGPCEALSRAGLDFLRRHAALPGGGWAKTLARDGTVLDPTLDLYDQAFVLYALAWRRRVFGDADAADPALGTLDAVERRLGQPGGRGFRSADPDPGGRAQNPHMHLLEACLAWIEAGGGDRYRALADAIVDLHLEVFQQDDSGALTEHFDDDWKPASGEPGRCVEPGHQYEWIWLMGLAGRVLDRDLESPARRLHAFARRHGHNPATGLCWDAVDREGRVLKPTSRIWAQTEALKAELALGEHWGGFDRVRIAEMLDLLLDKHLAWTPAGTWMDQFDAEGRPIADHIPASILYHLILAFAELLRLRDRIEA